MPETSHDGASTKVSGFSQVHLQKVGIRGQDEDVAALEGWLYLQHEAIPQHFAKKGKQRVRVVVHHHRMSVLKDDGTHRPLTLSNFVRRASLKALLRQHKNVVSQAVSVLQYAVGRKSGA